MPRIVRIARAEVGFVVLLLALIAPSCGEQPRYVHVGREEKMVTMRHPFLQHVCVAYITYDKNHESVAKPAHETWMSDLRHRIHTNINDGSALPLEVHYEGARDERLIGNNKGDTRWISMIHSANKTCRPYKWMLIADDDTYFVATNLWKVLSKIDEKVPYYFGYPSPPGRRFKANCRIDKDGVRNCCTNWNTTCEITDDKFFRRDQCTVEPARTEGRWRFTRSEQAKEYYPTPRVFHYGGAGAIVSVGLMDRMDSEDFKQCGLRYVCGGGDVRTAACIAAVGKIALTDFQPAGLFPFAWGRLVHMREWTPLQAVQRKISYHRAHRDMMHKLYNAELEWAESEGWSVRVPQSCVDKGVGCPPG